MDRLYSLIHVKSIDDEQRIVSGIATTPTPDRGDDVVEPAGVKFRNPLPFVLHHDKTKPVGHVTFGKATAAGVLFTAQIPKVLEPGVVRDRTDEAWHSAKYGLLRGVSIGYRPLKFDHRPTGGLHLKEIEVVELSMVTVPMNAEATITAIKSLDAAALAASGRTDRSKPAGVPASRVSNAMNQPISEQIAAEQRDLTEKHARMAELNTKESDDGGLNEAESTELSGLTKTVEALAMKIARLRTMESAEAALARNVFGAPVKRAATEPARIEIVRKEVKPWVPFVRYAMAVAAGKGSHSDTLAYARRWDAETPEVSAYIKALPGTAVVGTPAWGGELAYPTNLASAFLELLVPRTIVGRISGFNIVPFNVRFTEQTGGSTVGWVGEAAAKPVGELAFTEHFLTQSKIAGIVVLTDELIRLSSPSAEERVRNDLIKQISKFMDEQFVTPGISATANNPASVTNGAPTSAASGVTAAALRADIAEAIASFTAASLSIESLHIVTTEAVALNIAMLQNALGQQEFPAMTPRGGNLLGFPVIASNSVPSGLVIYLVAGEIMLADDGRVTLDASNQATLDMAGGNSPTFNLWQKNCTGIRAERWVRWQKARAEAVYYHTAAAYTG